MATGSYEGSLSMEDIPDHHEASLFTGRRPRWSRRSIASSDPYVSTSLERAKRANGEDAALAKASEAEAETKGRDRGVRGSIAASPWEENTHARVRTP